MRSARLSSTTPFHIHLFFTFENLFFFFFPVSFSFFRRDFFFSRVHFIQFIFAFCSHFGSTKSSVVIWLHNRLIRNSRPNRRRKKNLWWNRKKKKQSTRESLFGFECGDANKISHELLMKCTRHRIAILFIDFGPFFSSLCALTSVELRELFREWQTVRYRFLCYNFCFLRLFFDLHDKRCANNDEYSIEMRLIMASKINEKRDESEIRHHDPNSDNGTTETDRKKEIERDEKNGGTDENHLYFFLNSRRKSIT